jgi:hypothetical protein
MDATGAAADGGHCRWDQARCVGYGSSGISLQESDGAPEGPVSPMGGAAAAGRRDPRPHFGKQDWAVSVIDPKRPVTTGKA